MIKYFTIEDLLKHYLQKKFHILVDIPKNFRIWNDFSMYGNKEKAKQAFFQDLDPASKGDQCQKCGKCETVCPQSISIRKDLESAFRELNALK